MFCLAIEPRVGSSPVPVRATDSQQSTVTMLSGASDKSFWPMLQGRLQNMPCRFEPVLCEPLGVSLRIRLISVGCVLADVGMGHQLLPY